MRDITYRNLPAGRYAFESSLARRAANGFSGLLVPIHLIALYEQGWFIGLIILCVVIAAALVSVFARRRQHARHQAVATERHRVAQSYTRMPSRSFHQISSSLDALKQGLTAHVDPCLTKHIELRC